MVHNDFEKLQAAYDLRNIEIQQLNTRILSLEDEVARLKEQLRLQQERLFGKKSEASCNLDLSSSAADSPPNESGIASKTTTVSAHVRTTKPRGKRQLDTSNLPRHTIIHALPDDKQLCKCCGGILHEIGREISEQLEIIPIQYCVIEHIRVKYGCRPCEAVVMAPKPPAPLPKAIAGPSLLTDVILNKYQYHLPLYRQSKIMQSSNISISDKTLANWVKDSGEALQPVYEAFWIILQNRYLQVDETPVKVLETNKKGYVWAYFAPNIEQGLVVFEFSLTRKGSVAGERLKTFNGLLQTDGYKGYDALRKRDGIIGFGCVAHARRKFSEVIKIRGVQYGIAVEIIKRMKPLYELEERMRANNRILKHEAKVYHRIRKNLRQKIARPILVDMHKWLCSVKCKVLPKSKLGQAISYMLNQWPYIIAYLCHGMAEIDTNYVENKIRDIALGKKNWLTIGNEDCGKIHALWYTFVISAIINNINPRVYIHYLLTKVHDLRRKTIDPVTLLPDRIDLKELERFIQEQMDIGKAMMKGFNPS